MFKFISDKIENKFINVLLTGWTGEELQNLKGGKVFRFTSECKDFKVIAMYDKRGKLRSLSGGEGAMMKFISDTEEPEAAQQLVTLMFRNRYNRLSK